MNRFGYLLIFALLALSFLLPGQTARAETPVLPVTVDGIVTYNGAGVAGVTLKMCTPNCATDPAPITYITSADGKFSFLSTSPTGAIVEVEPKEGYFFGGGCPVPPTTVTPSIMPCPVTAFGARKISGRALWSGTSTPAAGVPVSIVPAAGRPMPLISSTLTDANGYYSFGSGAALDPNGLEPISYTLNIGPFGGAIFQPASGGTVDLSGGSKEVPIVVSNPARIRVYVYEPGIGGLIAGIQINLSSPEIGLSTTQPSLSTDYVYFNNLLETLKYTVTAFSNDQYDILTPSQTFNSLAGTDNIAAFTAVAKPYIAGKVTFGGKPLGGILMQLQKLDGTAIMNSISNAKGEFYLNFAGSGLPDGQYYVVASPQNAQNVVYSSKPQLVTISGASKKGLTVPLTNVKVGFRGQILTKGGVDPYTEVQPDGPANIPLSGVTVKVERCKSNLVGCVAFLSVVTDASGYYSFSLPATYTDWYRITPIKAGYQFANRSTIPLWLHAPYLGWNVLFLQDMLYPSFYQNPNFDAWKVYAVSGKVLNLANGAGIPGVTVTSSTVYNSVTYTRTAVTKADGSYVLPNVPDVGATTIAAQPFQSVGFQTPAGDPAYTFNPLPGKRTGQNFVSLQKFYSLSGTITKNGLPLSGVTVRLSSPETAFLPAVTEVVTGAAGTFRFPRVVAGHNYDVSVTKLGYNFAAGTVISNFIPPLFTFTNLDSNKIMPVKATLAKRTVNVDITGLAAGITVPVQYRQLPSGTWKTINVVTGTPTPLSLYVLYKYEFKTASPSVLFDPAVTTLPADYTGVVTLHGYEAVKLSGTVKVQNKVVSGALVTPSALARPTTVKTSLYGKYSLAVQKGSTPSLTLTHKYFTFDAAAAPLMDADKVVDVTAAWVKVSGRVVSPTGLGLGGVPVCASATLCTTTNAQGYYLLTLKSSDKVNLWSFTVRPKLAGKTAYPTFRPVSPSYGTTKKNFILK